MFLMRLLTQFTLPTPVSLLLSFGSPVGERRTPRQDLRPGEKIKRSGHLDVFGEKIVGPLTYSFYCFLHGRRVIGTVKAVPTWRAL